MSDNSSDDNDASIIHEGEVSVEIVDQTGHIISERARGREGKFRASNHWREAFMLRRGFSIRKPHPKR
jgi:hypothetical protein